MSKTLFKEALRQLKKAIILSLGIVCLIGMFWMVMGRAYPEFVPALYLRLCGIVVTIFLTVYLFRFIEGKSGSDFYYQVPWTKQKIALSYLAAIAVSVAVFISVMYLVAAILAAVLHTNYMSDPIAAASEYLFGLSACIYMFGVVFFAISLSGNMTSVLFIAAMVIIIPKAFFSVWYGAVYSNIPHLPQWGKAYDISAGLLTNQYNVIWTTVQNLISRSSVYSGESFATFAYSSAFGVLYLFFGIQIWKKRSAEAAGNPAVNGKVQAVLRMLPAAFCSFFMITVIFSAKANWNVWPKKITKDYLVALAGGFVGYLFCAALIYVYEMLTTRKLWAGKQYFISKFFRWAAILAGVDLLFFASVFIGHRMVWYEAPDASEINSIQVLNNTYMPDYVREVISEIYMEEDEIKELFAEGLKDTIASADDGVFLDHFSDGNLYEVFFHKNFKSIARYVYLDEEKEKRFAELLKENGVWDTVCSRLPEFSKVSLMGIDGEVDRDIKERVYQTLIEEVKEGSLTDSYTNNKNEVFLIDVLKEKEDGEDEFLYSVPVNTNYPETIGLLFRLFNERYSTVSPVEVFCKDIESGISDGELDITIWLSAGSEYEKKKNTNYQYFSKKAIMYADDPSEFCRRLQKLEKELLEGDEDGKIGWIEIQNYGGSKSSAVRFYSLTEESFDLYEQVIECGVRALEQYSKSR